MAVRTLSPDEDDRADEAIEVGPVGVAPAGRLSVEIGASDHCCADPVFDAVRQGVRRLPVVFRAGDVARAGEIALPAECDWEQAVALVAELVAGWLTDTPSCVAGTRYSHPLRQPRMLIPTATRPCISREC